MALISHQDLQIFGLKLNKYDQYPQKKTRNPQSSLPKNNNNYFSFINFNNKLKHDGK